MDFLKEVGALALSNRLKRIGDLMIRGGHALYKDLGVDIEPNWYLILLLLKRNKVMSITEIADSLGFTHPSINALVNKIARNGYIKEMKDKEDGRRRLLKLSSKGLNRIESLETIWKAGEKGIVQLIEETGYDIMDALEKLESRLVEKGFDKRTKEHLKIKK